MKIRRQKQISVEPHASWSIVRPVGTLRRSKRHDVQVVRMDQRLTEEHNIAVGPYKYYSQCERCGQRFVKT